MDDLFFARAQMGMSLAFHIVFAIVGMAMPVLMAISEAFYLRTRNPLYLDLTKRWAHGTAILFVVGAVSGTVLSFELGLLWPVFMEHAGAVIGMPFSLEGFAFFTEAIFLGLFLYGWNRMSPIAHWLCGVMVALSGMASGVFVVTANAWMNSPAGFHVEDGVITGIDPIAAMLNPAALHQTLHMALAALVAVGFLVAGIHAWLLLRSPGSEFHRKAFGIAAFMACVSIPLLVASGDLAAQRVAKLQPTKLAAMEAHFHTGPNAPLVIGGIVDEDARTVRGAIEIPSGLSLLVGHHPDTVVQGLEETPRDEWPNVALVHWSFDVMVACGMAMLGLAAWAGFLKLKRRELTSSRWLLRAFVAATPLGVIAVEAGWFVTEFGRQPWVIYGFLKTADAVTPMPGLLYPLIVISIVYLFLAVIVALLLKRQFVETAGPGFQRRKEKEVPDA
jgi:cytochrome bd ubiquinol oxidase subunit I